MLLQEGGQVTEQDKPVNPRCRCVDCGGRKANSSSKRCQPCYRKHTYPFPRERVARVLEEWAERWNAEKGNFEGKGALEALSSRTGLSPRLVYRVRYGASDSERGEGEQLSWNVVDKLFCAIGCVHLVALPPEQGGFSDIYFHGLDRLEDAA